jgi:hypothetical protein
MLAIKGFSAAVCPEDSIPSGEGGAILQMKIGHVALRKADRF